MFGDAVIFLVLSNKMSGVKEKITVLLLQPDVPAY
jgi:hypothetical protein